MTDKLVADTEASALPKQDTPETKDTTSKKRSHEDEPEVENAATAESKEDVNPTKRAKNESEEEDKSTNVEESKTEATPDTAADTSNEQPSDKDEKPEETLKDNETDEPEKKEPATENKEATTEKKEKAEEAVDKTEASEKPLLSASTTFKGGFGSFAGASFGTALKPSTGKSIFSEPQSKDGEPSKETSVFSTPSLFKGGFSSFSSFAAPASKANPWADTDGADKEKSKDSSSNGVGSSKDVVDQYAQVAVPLEQKKVETGEEYEESKFSCRAKLYALDITNSSAGWKERGVGTLHVNSVKKEFEDHFENKTKARIVMRADGILKVILNVPLTKGTEVFAGMKSSLASEKFVRITALEDGKPFQYSLRSSNADIAKELYEAIKKLIPS